MRLGRYRSTPAHLSSLLDQAGNVGTLTASAREVQTGLLTLQDAILHKHGDQLTGSAHVTEADVRSALPILRSVTPVASRDGRLTVRGTATLFGVSAAVDATVGAQDGKLVVVPDVPFGGLATITVFSDPRVAVQSVGASTHRRRVRRVRDGAAAVAPPPRAFGAAGGTLSRGPARGVSQPAARLRPWAP